MAANERGISQTSSVASVHEVIEAFRQAPSNAERGAKFEQLMVRYFELDPMLAATYERVWRWMDWPDRPGQDTGIDLVARRRDDGELCAIQCKFYEPTHTLAKADIDSFFTASGKQPFTSRIIISTTDRWGKNAEDALTDQTIPVSRISLADIAESPIDWELPASGDGLDVALQVTARNEARPHQEKAIQAVLAGLEKYDRGRLIMACGTGKTFTALRLAERWADDHGHGAARVLFCVPSIQLLSQSLREWTAQSVDPIRSFAVCSDPKASRSADREDISAHDVPLPASTDPAKLVAQVRGGKRSRGLTVVFCTYQSLPTVAKAQADGLEPFDLIVCDEAHRTTGVTLVGTDESNFVRVHDNTYIRASKRVYMTATPRIFADEVKGKAEEHSAVLASMDNEDLFGPELYRLSFGEAVEQRLLSDYKVLVLTVDEEYIAGPLQSQIVDGNGEIRLDDATKIVGCWNGLAKRAGADLDGNGFPPGSVPMQRAVAFLRDIASSQRLSTAFEAVIDAYDGTDDDVLDCIVRHVDGTMNALTRNEMLSWLKAPVPAGECRILSNARCLSEGVDVPALDAVMFLNPRNSIVDVVQSVGRVMRRAEGKDYGYIILPVGVPSGIAPEKALADNKRFKVVWDVLNALRAHDDRFNAMVNSIELNQAGDQPGGPGNGQLMGGHIPATGDGDSESVSTDGGAGTAGHVATQAALFSLTDWRDAVFAKIVKKVGTRTYWEDWAADVADIAATQRTRIRAAVEPGPAERQRACAGFVLALRDNLNDSITDADAVSMLSQHLITKPVFDALFEGYSFAAQNPVSRVMQAMLDQLDSAGLDAETQNLAGFYDSVRVYASQVTSAAGKQQVITELYERFFKLAFAKQADALGIVYTPIEVVDWLLRAANDVLETELGSTLSDHGVHILDGFAGTGTFIVRLLQSGVIRPADLAHKYAHELHANEIVLLAYYIAAVNIEATYHALAGGDYQPFPGITLTDTFQISEAGDRTDTSLLPANNDRISAQLDTPITVIVGNPPYSVGQSTANDDNANLAYPTLDARIGDTYAARTTARSRRTLYDSYLRAFRWASDRIGDRGVTAFVSNGGWIDANTGDGIRLSLADEYSALWVFNLRGNQRTAGEASRREGGKIFGAGSRNTVALLVGVKNSDHTGPCRISYRDVGDYLSREDKLAILDKDRLLTTGWDTVTPNVHGDWIGQRSNAFTEFTPIGDKKNDSVITIFTTYSLGLVTGRDAWVYNFSEAALKANVQRTISNYNADLTDGKEVNQDPTRVSWDRGLRNERKKGRTLRYREDEVYVGAYRPFTRQHLYFDRSLNAMIYQMPNLFPTPRHANQGFLIMGPTAGANFTALMVDRVPDLNSFGFATQFFPRWTYTKTDNPQTSLDDGKKQVDEWGYRQVDNITTACLARYRVAVGDDVTSDDVFSWVYAVLHAPDYRATFAADLKKMLPRIPLPTSRTQFDTFVAAGRELAELHLGADTVEPHPLVEHHKTSLADDDLDLWRVTKMKWRSKTDHSAIVYNANLTLTGVPDEAHRYTLGSRTALEWVMERYQVKIDKASGIRNDPNDWAAEHDDPRYIVDLLKRVTAISVRTVAITDQLTLLAEEGGA